MSDQSFKTYRKNKGVIFENNEHRITLKDSSIQAFDEFSTIQTGKNGIMYFYYTLEYSHRDCVDYEEESGDEIYKWKKKFSVTTSDFPAIQSFQEIVAHMEKLDIKKNGQKTIYMDKTIVYQYSMSTDSSFVNEDSYELTKIVEPSDHSIYYDVYFGRCNGCRGKDSYGTKITYLSEDDIVVLKEFINDFMNLSIEINNKHTLKMVKNEQCSKIIIGNQIVSCDLMNGIEVTEENLDTTTIDYIFSIGDDVSIHLAECFSKHETEYYKVRIVDINKDKQSVTIEDTYNEKKVIEIPINKIAYISNEKKYDITKQDVADFIKKYNKK